MEESILISIKKMLGVAEEYTHFDTDIKIGINSTLMAVQQLGVGVEEGLCITSDSQTWSDLLGTRKDLEAVKSYVYLKVKLLFDPPSNPSVTTSMEKQIQEFEWRLLVKTETVV